MAKIGTKPNGIHYLDVHVEIDGKLKRQRVSTDTRDRQEAERQRKAWVAGVHPKHPLMGGEVAPKGRVGALLASSNPTVRATGWTMERLLNRGLRDPEVWHPSKCKAQVTLVSNVKLLTARMGDKLASEVTTPYLKQVVDDMTKEGYRPASIKRHFAMISRIMQLAASEWIDETTGKHIIPVAPRMPEITVKNQKGEEAALTYDDEKLVFAAIDKLEVEQPHRNWRRYRMFVRVALDTGFRKEELLGLGPKNVYRRQWQGQERVMLQLDRYTTKSDKPRVIPCTAAVASLIPALDEQAIGGKWFPLGQAAWTMWDRIREEVRGMGGNIDKVDVHGLRHTCLTRLGKQGMDIKRLQLWAGHADIKTTQRYVHFNVDQLMDGTALLDNTADGNCGEEPSMSGFSNHYISDGNRDNLGAGTIN